MATTQGGGGLTRIGGWSGIVPRMGGSTDPCRGEDVPLPAAPGPQQQLPRPVQRAEEVEGPEAALGPGGHRKGLSRREAAIATKTLQTLGNPPCRFLTRTGPSPPHPPPGKKMVPGTRAQSIA